MNFIGVKSKYIYITIYVAILISLIGVLGGSLSHLSYTFGTLEQEGSGIISFIISAGIEFGQLAIAMGVAERRRQKKSAKDLIFYLSCFAFINFFGNVYHSASIYTGIRNLKMEHLVNIDYLVSTTILILSGALPILALSLTELHSIFFQKLQSERIMEQRMKKEAEKLNSNIEDNNFSSSEDLSSEDLMITEKESTPKPVSIEASKSKSSKKKFKIASVPKVAPTPKRPILRKPVSNPRNVSSTSEQSEQIAASKPVIENPNISSESAPAEKTEFVITKKPVPVIEKKPIDKVPTLFHPEDEENDPTKPIVIDALLSKRRVTIPRNS